MLKLCKVTKVKVILPPLFSNLFLFNKQVHINYYSRSADDYRSHNCRTNTNKFTVLFLGPSLWNSLPTYITNSETQFQEKTFILSIEPLSVTFVKSTILLPTISLLYLRRTTMRRPLSYKPYGFWGPPRHSFNFFSF